MADLQSVFSNALGIVFYSITVFGAGALIGNPLWNWLNAKLPWNKTEPTKK